MKKILYIIPVIMFLWTSCSEEFLDRKNLYEQTDESYFQAPEDIQEMLAGAYAALALDAGHNNPQLVADVMSDDCFGGGDNSNDIDGFHRTDNFTISDPDFYSELFDRNWEGILRTNLVIKRFDQVEYDDAEEQSRDLGEAHFLRAYFYFRASKFFGPVPLRLQPDANDLVRATPEEMYGQIASDMKKAIELLPSTPYQDIDVERLGHATKWAAEGIMARIFLFYTGYYQQTELPLAEGGSISKDQVINWIEDCIANSGHDLLTDFRNNWPYSSVSGYAMVANHNLSWAGEEGGNYETMLAIKYSPYAGYSPPDQQLRYGNMHCLYVGLRDQSYQPFGRGWGLGTVNPQLWESYEEGDLRREGSILNMWDTDNPDDSAITRNYIWGNPPTYNQTQETGYFQKKYCPTYDYNASGTLEGIYYTQYGAPSDFMLWNMQDEILIRYADVLLMAAELGSTNAADHFNAVRTRAGLDPIASPTLDDIKLERRHEFAFEGLRYHDLLRWGLTDAKTAIEAANGSTILWVGEEREYSIEFRTETGGFLPIPVTQVLLTNGELEQTPGW